MHAENNADNTGDFASFPASINTGAASREFIPAYTVPPKYGAMRPLTAG